ncbi:MAG: LAGLIDADG family homing endonuclease [archaeon]|nr:LAGLIDADG family homing endonuclease [archaeon]
MTEALGHRLKRARQDKKFDLDYRSLLDKWKRERVPPTQIREKAKQLVEKFETLTLQGKQWTHHVKSHKKILETRRIEFNTDFAFLCGAYLGQINLSGGHSLVVSLAEKEVAKEIAQTIFRVTGRLPEVKPIVKFNERSGTSHMWGFWHNDLALVHALEKVTRQRTSVPLRLLNTKIYGFDLKKSFLKGLFHCGGSVSGKGATNQQMSCDTINIKVAEQTSLLLSEFGIFGGTYKSNHKAGIVNIYEPHDIIAIGKLELLHKENQQKLEKIVEKIQRQNKSHNIREFEAFMKGEKVEAPDYVRRAWKSGKNIPPQVRKLAELSALSKKYKYPYLPSKPNQPRQSGLKFLEFYPLSLEAAIRKGSRKKTPRPRVV